MSASGSGRGRKRKNVVGLRSDPSREHGIEVDATSKKVKCEYCNITRSRGIYKLKHHLACTHQNVEPCPQVPEDVREKFMSLLRTQTLESQNKKKRMLDIGDDDSDEKVELLHVGDHENKQKHYRRMDKFVVNNAIPFNCVNNPIFPLMVKKIGDYGKGLVPPSYHEIRVTFLKKEVQETLQLLDEFKEQWKKTGCTIMSDGWSDRKRRSICNFLVNSPNGTIFLSLLDTSDISKTGENVFEMLGEIVEKVGMEHVVQVVTDNASNYKLTGEMLMDKRKSLFWTPCAAHCKDLMLEDFEKQIQLHQANPTSSSYN
ncbi:uncharacterized protein LOC114299600 [Camellia sinensis]|uniref:uncharacterized protein LOC114299600 n=1 Tax=Camellia sinensis TaxID=4442 RepID=UPI001035754E|nr:uncharacterized protein LOC114299600 [Camellia sinensis]